MNIQRNPKISIVIPALNEEKLIANTLLCFPLTQRRKFNLELIVSDGGSSDKTIDIAKKLADKVVEHKEKEGKQFLKEGIKGQNKQMEKS